MFLNFTTISYILFIYNLIRYALFKLFPNLLSEKVKQNLNNISALSYSLIVSTSIIGIISVNYYNCCLNGKTNTYDKLKRSDKILHIIPLLLINLVAPKPEEISIKKEYLYSFTPIMNAIYCYFIDFEKIYYKVPQSNLLVFGNFIALVSTYLKY